MRALVLSLVPLFGAAAHAQQPVMPPAIEALFAAGGREIKPDTRCEVIDWAVDPAHGWPEEAVKTARRYTDICALPVDDLTPETAAARLGAETLMIDVEGNVLTVVAKSSAPDVFVCCAPQMDLKRIGGSDYWASRRRLAGADRAMISLMMPGNGPKLDWKTWRGPNAPARPDEIEIGKLKGQMLERELKSAALDETRVLKIYLPPGHTKDRVWPALFMGDADAVEFAGLVEKMVEAGEMAPIVIISAESGEEAVIGTPPAQYGDDLRSADYLRFWPEGGDRFDRHMEFFAKELVDYAVAEFGVSKDRKDRAVSGKSSGGVLAMWAGVLRADACGAAVPMSPGWITLKPEHLPGGERARFFVSGGQYEPGFILAARASEAVLKAAGYDVTGRYYAAGHYHDQWAVALREALKEIFPPR